MAKKKIKGHAKARSDAKKTRLDVSHIQNTKIRFRYLLTVNGPNVHGRLFFSSDVMLNALILSAQENSPEGSIIWCRDGKEVSRSNFDH